MGKKRKSHKLHLLQGTAKGKGKLESRPPPATSRWNCPSWLGEEGRDFHKTYWALAEAMGRISEADRAAWFNLCQRWQRIRECEAAIDEHGVVVPGRSGELKRNPACATLKAEQEAFRRERAIFGLDPEARSQLGFKFDSPKDEYQRFLAKKSGKMTMQDMID